MNKKTVSRLHAAVMASLMASFLAGCATDQSSSTTSDTPPAEAVKAAPACPDCSTAAEPKPAVDGNLAWRQSKEQSLADARAFASRVQALKLPLTVQVAKAHKKDEGSGRVDEVDAVKNVLLHPLPTAKISSNNKVWAEAIRELGKRAAQANAGEPQQIVVSALARSKARVARWIDEGIASAGNKQKPDIQFFNAKQAKDTAIFYQPLDQKQFKTE